MITGRVYDIQPFSVHDGPGVRTTIFLKGCPLRCPWCHSPESQAFYKQLSWFSMRCLGTKVCNDKCLKACEKGAIEYGQTRVDGTALDLNPGADPAEYTLQLVHVKRDLCDNCGDCAKVCRAKALELTGTDYTVDELVRMMKKDKQFFDKTGGGVTVSGGEALSQPEFTLALLKALKDRGYHTALDTTGFAPWAVVESVLPYVDIFLLDLKHMDSATHEAVVKVPNGLILENARKIAAAGGKFQIRVPIIPGFNASEKNMRETAEFCVELGESVEVVQLLPYHNLGVAKYARIGDDKVLQAEPPTDEFMEHMKEICESYGLKTIIH